MIVQSLGQLASFAPPQPTWQYAPGSLDLYTGSQSTYLAIYRSQPNVRICVDFLARNVAQLGLHAFRRISDTDRERLHDHPLTALFDKPNAATTRYRLIESLMQDLGIYFRAYWLKIRSTPMGLVRLPPEQMSIEGGVLPSMFVWTDARGTIKRFEPSEIVYFSGYGDGISPLETLRRTLAEEAAAGDYRQSMWNNAARVEGVIERPKDAPKWSPTQKQTWREQWQATYANGGTRPGSVAVLEDGMSFRQVSYSSRDLEYSAARKLAREECAASYHIPLPMVGILEHATFSNIVEQHKNLYSDALGPWLEMIQSECERQVVPEFDDFEDIYLEFNIADKLKGSFEQQASSLQILCGRPLMTGNEGRARLNLPRITDDPTLDTVAAQQGGPSDASVTGAPAVDEPPIAPVKRRSDLKLVKSSTDLTRLIAAHGARQMGRLQKVAIVDRPATFLAHRNRWTDELATDLARLTGAVDESFFAGCVMADTLERLEDDARLAQVQA